MNAGPNAPAAMLHSDDRGSISMIGLLCLGAFACLLFAVINVGVAVTEKVELQNASDASVLSGATIVARGLNLIALNNNTQAKLVALATIHYGLQSSIPIMKMVHKGYRMACTALAAIPFVGAGLSAACHTAVAAGEIVLAAWEYVVNATKGIFQHPSGIAWKIMRILETFSRILADGIPALAAVEAWRIARENGADFGLMISPKILGSDLTSANLFMIDFPVHRGTFRDLCGPARRMAAETRNSPVMSWGWDFGVDPVAGGIAKIFGGKGVAGSILDGMIAARFASQCGTGEAAQMTIPADLPTCRRDGGTAVWDYKEAALRPDTALPPSPLLDNLPVLAQRRYEWSCSRTPPGRRVSVDPEVYQSYVVSFGGLRSVQQYAFVQAQSTKPVSGGSFDQGSSSLPRPYMLGKGAEKPSETAERLNYLAVAYRKRSLATATNVFKDVVWGEMRFTYAQARVYNASEFSSFSQDWRVKLVPADLGIFSSASGSASTLPGGIPQLGRLSGWIDRIKESVPTTH